MQAQSSYRAIRCRLDPAAGSRRIFCRACLDWSERRWHVAGHVGTELCRRLMQLGWLTRMRDTRALRVTPIGRTGLVDAFGVRPGDDGRAAAKAERVIPHERTGLDTEAYRSSLDKVLACGACGAASRWWCGRSAKAARRRTRWTSS